MHVNGALGRTVGVTAAAAAAALIAAAAPVAAAALVAAAQAPPETPDRHAAVEAAIYTRLAESADGRVPVIAVLRGGGVAEDGSAGLTPARLAAIADLQQQVLDRLPAGSFRLGHRYATFPAFSGLADANAVDALGRDPGLRLLVADGGVTTARLETSVPFVNADPGQTLGFTGEGVTVAVLDTGIDTDHPDLVDNIAPGAYHFLDNGLDVGPGAEDVDGHGTAVSGIITSAGVVAPPGIAPDADILAVKVLNDDGGGTFGDVLAGIDYVTSVAGDYERLCAINMSLSSINPILECPCDVGLGTALDMAMTAARGEGIVSFAATGNDFACPGMGTPACVSSGVAVAAVYDDDFANPDEVTDFTNRNDCNDLAGPGAGIRTSSIGGGATNTFGGTSAATPHVAGVAALLCDKRPLLGAGSIVRLLRDTAAGTVEPCGTPLPRRVDAAAALCASAGDETKTSAADAGPGRLFGSGVALFQNRAVIGAEGHDANGGNAGAAYVFVLSASGWDQEVMLLPDDGAPGARFGAAVDGDASVVVIGAPADDAPGAESGSAYVFRRVGAVWMQEQKLTPVGMADGDAFGSSVGIAGDVIVVGAPANDIGGNPDGGSVTVFRYDGASWANEQTLTPGDAQPSDFFGGAVAVDGDVMIAGALGDDDGAASAGAAYVFRHDGATWVEEQELLASDALTSDGFGISVDVAGSTAVIGAYRTDDLGGLSGSAYVFDHDGSSWGETQKLLASDGSHDDWFGWSVSLDPSGRLAVGAPNEQDNGDGSGAAYVFSFDGAEWTEDFKRIATDGRGGDQVGHAVAVSAQTVLLGAPNQDGFASDAGAIYFTGQGSPLDCNGNGLLDDCEIAEGAVDDDNGNGIPDECECRFDLDGSGTVGITDLLELLAAWDTNPGGPPDFDGDGVVGIGDLLALLAAWGPC